MHSLLTCAGMVYLFLVLFSDRFSRTRHSNTTSSPNIDEAQDRSSQWTPRCPEGSNLERVIQLLSSEADHGLHFQVYARSALAVLIREEIILHVTTARREGRRQLDGRRWTLAQVAGAGRG
ncbi:hypothetical protein B0H21DRAFT_242926 [Amylocystis lapponica]|nr:hypothetical protein B0H21DRAFT_242926 [Amylocystis lapponica]